MKTLLAVVVLAGAASAQVDAKLQEKINLAIDKGVVWVKSKQITAGAHRGSFGSADNPVYNNGGASGGQYMATTVLCLLTLLKCDVDPDDASIRDGLAYLEVLQTREFGDMKKGSDPTLMGGSYEAGVMLMMYEALYDARILKKMKADGKDPKVDPRPKIELSEKDRKSLVKVTDWLKVTFSKKGGWRYGPPQWVSPGGIHEDPSATQIVLLGLTSASRMGIEVEEEVWQKAAVWYLEMQEKNGPAVKAKAPAGAGTYAVRDGDRARGWSYLKKGKDEEERVAGGTTVCGVCSLILCKAALSKSKLWTKGLAAAVDRGIYDGIAWLDLHYSVTENPNGTRSHYYYLYGLERLGTFGGFERIGEHPWYVDGAKMLVERQRGEGKWYSGLELQPCDTFDTCFALLFLKRATRPVDVTLTR